MEDSKELPVVGDIVSLSQTTKPHALFNDMRILKCGDGFMFKSETTVGHCFPHPTIKKLMEGHEDWAYIHITNNGVKRCYQRPTPQVMRVIKD